MWFRILLYHQLRNESMCVFYVLYRTYRTKLGSFQWQQTADQKQTTTQKVLWRSSDTQKQTGYLVHILSARFVTISVFIVLCSLWWFVSQCFDTVGWASGKTSGRKNWVTRCWSGYLSRARCRLFAYGPADATASQNPIISCLICIQLSAVLSSLPAQFLFSSASLKFSLYGTIQKWAMRVNGKYYQNCSVLCCVRHLCTTVCTQIWAVLKFRVIVCFCKGLVCIFLCFMIV